jgi:putative ABC transport system permease protein
MSFLRAARAGLRTLFNRKAADAEMDEELRHFIALAAEEKARDGTSPLEAERAARMGVGPLPATREQVRDGGWESRLESVLQDLRFAMRSLRRTPGFALVAVATIALGVGANTAMFSVVNAVMLRPLPYGDADRVTVIWTDNIKSGLHQEATAYSTIMDWRASARTFEQIAFYSTQRVAPLSAAPGGPRGRSRLAYVSANLLPVLGVNVAIGRGITPDEESAKVPVAVISHGFWLRWFSGDSAILGKTVTLAALSKLGDAAFTIVGVLPPDFYFPDRLTEVFVPSTAYWRFDRETSMRVESEGRRWIGVGRLANGSSLAEARADLARIGATLASQYAADRDDYAGFATTVVPVLDTVAGQSLQTTLWILLGAVSVVLLIACVNVANLLLARGASRQQEFAVRRALGAGRLRLMRQLTAECLVLAMAGGAVGMLLTVWATAFLGRVAAGQLPRLEEIGVDWRVMLFALAASVAAGLIFGLAPAWRLSSTDASEMLREGGRGSGRAGVTKRRGVLVLAECALALVLLAGAGLLLRSLQRIESVNPGFDPSSVLSMRLEFAPPDRASGLMNDARAYADAASADVLLDRLRSHPGVESVGFVDDLFIAGQGNDAITIPGRDPSTIPAGELNYGIVSPGFFAALRVPLRAGRYLERADIDRRIAALWTPNNNTLTLEEKERVARFEPVVVNEAFVKRFFPNESPVGRHFCVDPTHKTYWYEIVGVVGDMHRSGLERAAIPEFYGPYFPSPNGRADLLVRTKGDPLAMTTLVRGEARKVFPEATVVTVGTADAQLGGFIAQRKLQTMLLSLFALLALTLAAIGIFGLVHFAVTERTREIGVRLALGATPGEVLALVISQGMRTPLLGIAIGVAVSLAATRVLNSLLFGVGATDPVTFGGVVVLLTGVAALACWLAARRVVRVDPVQALRS